MGLTTRLTTYMSSNGLEPRDVPRAIFLHEALGLCMLALTWGLCYLHLPSQNQFLRPHFQKAMSFVPQNVKNFANSKLPISTNYKIERAYLESSFMRKVIRPITLPGKLWLTYELVSMIAKNEGRTIAAKKMSSTVGRGPNLVKAISSYGTNKGKRSGLDSIFI